MTDKSKDALRTGIVTSLIVALITALSILYSMNYDYVKKVDARCVELERSKADKADIIEVKNALIRIEEKIDNKFDRLQRRQ